MSRIFLSHSSSDDHKALALRDWLAKEGWSADTDVYLDIHPDSGMAAGERWVNALQEAATRCEVVVFLISDAWLSSKWCSNEMRLAETLNKKIFALRVEDIEISRLPRGLTSEWQVIMLHSEPFEQASTSFQVNHPLTNTTEMVFFSNDGLQRLENGLKKAGIGADTFELQAEPDSKLGWRLPYRGLEPLEAADAAVFFGRDADIVRCIDTLRGLSANRPPRMLAILGASGSGKSSFLRAGVLPRLLRDDSEWVSLSPLRVADHGAIDGPEGLIQALQSVHELFGTRVNRADLREITSSPQKFVEHLVELRATAARRALLAEDVEPPMPILAIDQAEELSFSDANPEATTLLTLIRAAMDSGDLVLIITIRSDSYDILEQLKSLNGVHRNLLSLEPIARGEIARIIRMPGEVLRAKVGAQAPIFSAEVVEALQREMEDEPDALPLLAFALRRLFNEYAATPSIGLDELAVTGGIASAIGAAANAVLSAAGVGDNPIQRRKTLRAVFIPRLARFDPVSRTAQRRVAIRSSFVGTDVEPIVDALVDQRLLVTTVKDALEPTVEVAHEALLRQWPELVYLLDEDREALAQLDVIQRAVREWSLASKAEKSEFLVHRGQRLADAEVLLARSDFASAFGDVGSDYLTACRVVETEADAAREREIAANERAEAAKLQSRRTRWLGASAVAIAIIMASVAFWGFAQKNMAEVSAEKAKAAERKSIHQRQKALTIQSRFLADLSRQELEAGELRKSAWLAMEALPSPGTSDRPIVAIAVSALHNALASRADQWPEQRRLDGHEGVVLSAVFSADGSRVLTASEDGTARIWQADGSDEPVVLRGHERALTSAVFSADGSRVLTASEDGTARIWQADDSGEAVVLGHEGAVFSAVFSADGSRVLTASEDGTARIWQADGSGKPVILSGHEEDVISAVFSADESRVLTASWDDTARIWQADGTGEPVVLRGHEGWVNSAVFSADGSRALTASNDGTARIWQADGSGEAVVLGHEGAVFSAVFSADGSRVLTASEDGTARIWQADGSDEPVVLGHEGAVFSAVFSADGSRVLTASEDKTARIWQADGSGQRVVLSHEGLVHSAVFSADGSRVLTASEDKTARIWQADGSGEPVVHGHVGLINSAVFSADGSRVLTASNDDTARIWQTDGSGEPVVLRGHEGWVNSAVFSADGSRALTASNDGTARIWQADGSGEPVVLGHEGRVNSAVFSADGSRVLTASDDKTARIWPADGSGEAMVLRGHEGKITLAVFSADGSRVLTASEDGTARIWQADGSGEPVVFSHEGRVYSAVLSADGGQVLTVSQDGTARIWRADGSGEPVVLSHDGWVWSAVLSADGSRVLTASEDGTARIWQADDSGEPVVLSHEEKIALAVLSADGSRVLTASEDGTARIWQADGSSDPVVLRGHEELVHSAVFSADGSRVLTASYDGTVRIWQADIKGLITAANRILADTSPLTPKEREQYFLESTSGKLENQDK